MATGIFGIPHAGMTDDRQEIDGREVLPQETWLGRCGQPNFLDRGRHRVREVSQSGVISRIGRTSAVKAMVPM